MQLLEEDKIMELERKKQEEADALLALKLQEEMVGDLKRELNISYFFSPVQPSTPHFRLCIACPPLRLVVPPLRRL